MADLLRKLNFTILSVLTLVWFPADAQEVSQGELAKCATKRTAAEKLACYEALTVVPEPAVESRAAAARTAPEPNSRAPAAVASEGRPNVPDDLGAEHLGGDEEQSNPSTVTAIVSGVTESGSGKLYFHFANGQVWRQIEPRRFHYPKNQAFEVTVSQGMMGDYRLRVGGEGPMTRIRRVE